MQQEYVNEEAMKIIRDIDPAETVGMVDLITKLQFHLERLYTEVWLTDPLHRSKRKIKKQILRLIKIRFNQ